MTQGCSIRLFLVDGGHNGVLTAEIMNWTGHVLTGPRSKLSEILEGPEGTWIHSGQSKPGLDNADAATIIGGNNTSHASQRCAPREVTFFGAA